MKKYLVQGAVYEISEYSGRMTQGINKLTFEAENPAEAICKYNNYWATKAHIHHSEVLKVYEEIWSK